eukprot:950871-Pelagomonas_calceolata.AAC.1
MRTSISTATHECHVKNASYAISWQHQPRPSQGTVPVMPFLLVAVASTAMPLHGSNLPHETVGNFLSNQAVANIKAGIHGEGWDEPGLCYEPGIAKYESVFLYCELPPEYVLCPKLLSAVCSKVEDELPRHSYTHILMF